MSNIFNYQYSIFGDFGSIISNIQEVAKKFENFSKEVTNLINPIGQQQPLYVFNSPEIGLRITLDRIDFLFTELSDNDIDKINSVLTDGFGLTYFKNINRIAINYSRFVREDYQNKLNILKNKAPLLKFEDGCRELNIRCNYESSLDNVSLNNIVSIQNTIIQDSRSFESFSAVLFSLDINTVVLPQLRFEINEVIPMFKKIKNMAEKEMSELIENVRD